MGSKDMPVEALQKQILALDDQIEALVMSIDPEAPETHAAVYAEIEKAHETIFALRDEVKKREPKA